MKKSAKKWGADRLPTLTELKIAADNGMTPSEYCTALNAEEAYERQIAEEEAARESRS